MEYISFCSSLEVLSKYVIIFIEKQLVDTNRDWNPNLLEKNTTYANFIWLLKLKQRRMSHKKFACMVFFSNNQIRIIYLWFSEFQLVSNNCFSMKQVPNEKIKFFVNVGIFENFDKFENF